jgi:hypothetical protein
MSNECELFHGASGDSVLSIIRDRSMRPGPDHKVYYSQRFDDALQHGGDMKRKAAFAFKAKVTIPAGASLARAQRPGNPLAVIVTTVQPLPTKILELYVRRARATQVEIIRGAEAITEYLSKP